MHSDGKIADVKRERGLTSNARRGLRRLAVIWAVLLFFVVIAAATHSLTLLLIGVVAATMASLLMRTVGR
jgi:Flp pilus assembly protein TadB